MRQYMFVLAILLAGTSVAHAQAAVVEVHDAWARATTTNAIAGGVFLTIQATGGVDRLVSVASPVAEAAELHETVNEAGIMKMKPVAVLAVEPGKPVVLKPGSYHIMLSGLKRPLRQGESFPVVLTFERAPAVTATVQVQAAGASGPGHGH